MYILSNYLIFKSVSIASCLGRNDYNIVFSILTLMILTNFYNQSPKNTTKLLIQLLGILSIADIIWIMFFSSAWTHLTEDERKKNNINDLEDIIIFWDSLSFIHGLVYFLAFIELIIKGLLLYYLLMDYNGKYSWKDLLNLNYDNINKNGQVNNEEQNQCNNISNDLMEIRKEAGTNSFEENFQNDFDE